MIVYMPIKRHNNYFPTKFHDIKLTKKQIIQNYYEFF